MKKSLSLLAIMFTTFISWTQCNLTVDLGNDTIFCSGQSLHLIPGSYDSYLWEDNSTSPSRFVSQPGTYFIQVGTSGFNLVINGDFEMGNSSFTTDYTVGAGGASGQLTNPSTYAISSSPSLVRNNFSACQDHTPAPGTQMMIVNGAGTPGTHVWCQTVTVSPNTDYQFQTWTSSALSNPAVAQLQFAVNGSPIGSVFSPLPIGCAWSQFTQTWNSGAQISANICILSQNSSGSGNDFAIDDISFAPVCYARDTIIVANYPQPVIITNPSDSICSGQIFHLTASSSTPGLNYTWNPGNINTANVDVTPNTSTNYSVSAVSPDGCTSNIASLNVSVHPTPDVSIFINGNDTVCNGDSNILDGLSTVPNCTYSWSPIANTTNQLVVTASVPSSTYGLTVTSPFGCTDNTSVTIRVIPDLHVSISGSPIFCEGSSSQLTVTSNQPQMSYHWSTNGSTSNQITVTQANEGWVYVTGDYFYCDQAKDSIQVIITPDPIVTVPQDVEVCPGEPVNAVVSSNQSGSTFTWQPGNLSGSTNTLSVSETTLYTVYAQNGTCVSDPATFTINVSPGCYLTVPNVFTPNNDGKNDFFQLVDANGIKTLNCTILNRWGNIVRTFDSPDFKWDGKDQQGNYVTNGVYFYKISAETTAKGALNETGMVEIIN